MGDENVVRAIYLFNLARQQGTNGGRSLDDGSMGVFGSTSRPVSLGVFIRWSGGRLVTRRQR